MSQTAELHNAEDLVEVRNLVKYFPVRAGLLQLPDLRQPVRLAEGPGVVRIGSGKLIGDEPRVGIGIVAGHGTHDTLPGGDGSFLVFSLRRKRN